MSKTKTTKRVRIEDRDEKVVGYADLPFEEDGTGCLPSYLRDSKTGKTYKAELDYFCTFSHYVEVDVATADFLPPNKAPVKYQVWRVRGGEGRRVGVKFVVKDEIDVAEIEHRPENYEFVAHRPHGDDDFSYLCGFDHCKCQS